MNKKQITRSPIDDSVYAERELASKTDIELAIEKSHPAHKAWRQTSLKQRAEICHLMLDAFASREDEIAHQLCWMMGRPIRYAKGEVTGTVERGRYMIDAAKEALAPIELDEKPGFLRYIKREPLGLVFVIAPWNYPYLTAINTLIPAIMAGNSVILKHSAQTPLCGEQLARAFQQASLPDGVFQYLHLSHADTEYMIAQQDIHHVAFTGSVAGGKMVERASSGRFLSIGLELGGKDPAYVRADADIAYAVSTCVDGAFFNSGQSCCAIERIYVHSAVFDDFVSRFVAQVKKYKLGRPDDPDTTLGPVINASAADFIRQQVAEAVSAGAKAHINYADFPCNRPGTAYLAPQVLTCVNHNMSVMKDESFGPVIGIMKVDSDQQALELMNDSELGLTAAVFTQDIDAGIALGEQLETGTFFINRCDYLDPALAWTGVKNSGRGCTLSKLGYESLTRPKSFHLKTRI